MRNLEHAWTSLAVFGKFTEHQQEALMARAASKKSPKKRGAASSRKAGQGSARKGPTAKREHLISDQLRKGGGGKRRDRPSGLWPFKP